MINPDLQKLIQNEFERQQNTLTLIPSENYVSPEVQAAQASCFTNKYAEGYPTKRYYGGTIYCDELELMCQSQAQKVFNTDYAVNVQPYSGSPANLAVYYGLLEPGDKIMGLDLKSGGHLTHGAKVSAMGKIFQAVSYGLNSQTQLIDYEELERLAIAEKPKLIIAGATAYSRTIDFSRFSTIAKKVGAYLLADISHISGLVATGLHPTPFGFADVVMTTTHKMLRGPRGALIFSANDEISAKINKAVFPGLQGGPHMHTISAVSQSLFEAGQPNYKFYCQQILDNAQAMVKVLQNRGFEVVSGGTDNHLWLLDLRNKNISGAEAQTLLESNNIIVNKNSIPFDPASPFAPSGIRMGTPAITTRGLGVTESAELAECIVEVITKETDVAGRISILSEKYLIPTQAITKE